jgi:hypothetical protein
MPFVFLSDFFVSSVLFHSSSPISLLPYQLICLCSSCLSFFCLISLFLLFYSVVPLPFPFSSLSLFVFVLHAFRFSCLTPLFANQTGISVREPSDLEAHWVSVLRPWHLLSSLAAMLCCRKQLQRHAIYLAFCFGNAITAPLSLLVRQARGN